MQGFSKPVTFAIPWTHAPAASKLGASPLRQSRRCGTFHLMEFKQTLPTFCSNLIRFFFFCLFFLVIHNMGYNNLLQPVLIYFRHFHMQVLIGEGVAFLGYFSQ